MNGLVVDLFAGGGGASAGIEAALGRPVDIAINHSATALAVHAENHPETLHLTADIWEVKPREATGGRPVDVLWASPDCFPAGTLILTPDGLRPIESVGVGQLVMTHRNRWQRVISTMTKEADTVEVRGHGHPGLVTTPNHPFYSKRITKRYPGRKKENGKREGLQRTLVENPFWPAASDMVGKLWATPRAYPDAAIPTCAGAEFSADFFYLVGRWIGDGSLNKGDAEICCGLNEVEGLAGRLAANPLKRANGEVVPHRVVDHGSSQLFVWGNAPLVAWLRSNFGDSCESKRLPVWCLAMQAGWRRALLAGYVDSDGYEGVRTETSSVSRALAIGIRLLAVSLGHAAAMYMQPGRPGEIEGRRFVGRDVYHVAWRENLQSETVMWDRSHLFSPVREVKSAGRQTVYSLEVEEDESYVADGIVVHNCTHFSVAKGDVPRDQGIRSLAWAVVRWAKDVRPSVIFVENVGEFRKWGPLGKDGKPDKAKMGQTFEKWRRALERLGYVVDFKVLDASLYGAPTRRRRLFIVARCDGQSIVWPEPTHGPGLLPLHTAAECIDWSIPCPSIFTRKRPLAEKTLWRIAQGIKRFVLENPKPFIVKFRHDSAGAPIGEPLPTVTAGGKERPSRPATGNPLGFAVPTIVKVNHGKAEARGEAISEPLSTVTATQRGHAVVLPSLVEMNHSNAPHGVDEPLGVVTGQHNRFNLVAPTLVQTGYGERPGQRPRYLDLQAPIGTLVDGQKHGLVAAFLAKHFGGVVGQSVETPASTVTAQDHHALVSATMVEPGQRHGRGTRDAEDPLSTVVAKDRHAVAAAALVKFRGDEANGHPGTAELEAPLPTITGGGNHIAEVRAFLTAYYGSEASGQSLLEPARTITAKHRLGLVTVDGIEHQIVDIGMRMLEPHELLRAQFGRFAEHYTLEQAKTKAAKVRLIGNSVCPEVAEAVVAANILERAEAAA